MHIKYCVYNFHNQNKVIQLFENNPSSDPIHSERCSGALQCSMVLLLCALIIPCIYHFSCIYLSAL